MPEERQLKMDLPPGLRSYGLEEMGDIISSKGAPPALFLRSHVMREIVGEAGGFRGIEVGQILNVSCPFCDEGRLQGESVKPKYEGGPGSRPSTQSHVGDGYVLTCTKCDASFHGTHQWMWYLRSAE